MKQWTDSYLEKEYIKAVYGHPAYLIYMQIVCVLVTQWCLTLSDRTTVAHQAPLSMAFSRQDYWSGLPFSTPGNLPNPGIEPIFLMSPALADIFFTTAPLGKPINKMLV